MYYRTYTYTSYLILVLRSISLFYGSYTCITEHMLGLRILYLFYRAYSCISDLILVLRSIYLSYGTYTCITEHILVLRILYLYYGYGSTHRYYRTDTEVPVGTIRAELNSFLSYCSLFKFTWFMFHDFIIQIGTYGTQGYTVRYRSMLSIPSLNHALFYIHIYSRLPRPRTMNEMDTVHQEPEGMVQY